MANEWKMSFPSNIEDEIFKHLVVVTTAIFIALAVAPANAPSAQPKWPIGAGWARFRSMLYNANVFRVGQQSSGNSRLNTGSRLNVGRMKS